jgi:ABC-type Na+ efflux pump permease subunit
MTVPVSPSPRMQVVVSDVEMPFLSMVVFIIKWTIAAIPAMIVLFILSALVAVLFGGIFHAMFGGLIPKWPTS